jgi:NTP pyrophosphatase (non-canonical NTP hydrolase)
MAISPQRVKEILEEYYAKPHVTEETKSLAALLERAASLQEEMCQRISIESASIDGGEPLTFEHFAAANQLRNALSYQGCDKWNLLEWCGALCGEAGEAANLAKKIRRLDNVAEQDMGATRAELTEKFGEELADVQTYNDLAAARAGLILEKEVVEKFNEKSREVGSDVFLPNRFEFGEWEKTQSVLLPLSQEEYAVLYRMREVYDCSPQAVIRRALRILQLVDAGAYQPVPGSVIEDSPGCDGGG